MGLIKCSHKFDGRTKFSTYAYKPIYWSILKYHRKESMKKNLLKNNINKKNDVCLFNFLDILDDEETQIVDRILAEYSYQDIANELNISKSSVYRKYNKILEKIRNESTK